MALQPEDFIKKIAYYSRTYRTSYREGPDLLTNFRILHATVYYRTLEYRNAQSAMPSFIKSAAFTQHRKHGDIEGEHKAGKVVGVFYC